ncbi:basic salivary proline-rich protein 4-like [Cervus elaphus]|uniref:basic salivary proline-rich protein 4-like n=1 Tax=Cervus elaphus TaxID=9860 RepID=UPI001CC30A7B|nr:basic salivary proline-rich protein 4-like [Cervus elaphus]
MASRRLPADLAWARLAQCRARRGSLLARRRPQSALLFSVSLGAQSGPGRGRRGAQGGVGRGLGVATHLRESVSGPAEGGSPASQTHPELSPLTAGLAWDCYFGDTPQPPAQPGSLCPECALLGTQASIQDPVFSSRALRAPAARGRRRRTPAQHVAPPQEQSEPGCGPGAGWVVPHGLRGGATRSSPLPPAHSWLRGPSPGFRASQPPPPLARPASESASDSGSADAAPSSPLPPSRPSSPAPGWAQAGARCAPHPLLAQLARPRCSREEAAARAPQAPPARGPSREAGRPARPGPRWAPREDSRASPLLCSARSVPAAAPTSGPRLGPPGGSGGSAPRANGQSLGPGSLSPEGSDVGPRPAG